MDKSINNSCGQLALQAIKKLYQNVEIANVLVNENGFTADFLCDEKISLNDISKIEKEIKRLIAGGKKFEVISKLSKPNSFQKELMKSKDEHTFIKMNDFENISFYETVSAGSIKFYKIVNVGGVYWNNDSKNKQLTRLMGVAFSNKEDFEKWEAFVEDQKQRDHRKLGQDMEIFTFDEKIGQGLPIWLPNGEIIKKQIKKTLWDIFEKENFRFVDTPVLGSKELYEISGHWDHYKENNFPPLKIDAETFILRPMTCPHHLIIYKQTNHSYKELPYSLCEDSKLHRYESSGGLIGLERVRSMELFDCHIICKPDDIESTIKKLDGILKQVHQKMDIKIDRVDLSLHDPKDKVKYHDDPKMWKSSEGQLRSILNKLDYKPLEIEGEAAFYGPKIDYQVKSNLGKMITISTIQLDFLLPQRFDLEYIDENNEKKRPVLIHFGVIGTYERFIATLLSQTKGILPFWMVPTQITIIPINNKFHLEYASKIYESLKEKGFRVKLDSSDERLNKKIRDAQTSKIPYQIIIGDNEVKDKKISYRPYSKQDTTTCLLDEFIKILK